MKAGILHEKDLKTRNKKLLNKIKKSMKPVKLPCLTPRGKPPLTRAGSTAD